MGFVVKKPGMCTTVQDFGRIGYQGSGFPPSGVMDRHASTLANLLVDNTLDTCVLEFALNGPTLRFTTNAIIAITGGDFSPMLGGKPIPMYEAVIAHRGSVLSFGEPKTGSYAYLAIAGGGVRVPMVMGSYSTNLKCSVGGWKGRKLMAGDYLPFTTKSVEFLPNLGSHTLKYDGIYGFGDEHTTLRVVPGPQEYAFSEDGINCFYGEAFELTHQYDRMGYRLDGPEVETVSGSDIISDAIAFGAVQIPKHGRPIILLCDRQTTGGYAKIGTIASVDIPKLVQRRPGDKIRFAKVSVNEAQRLYREESLQMRRIAKMVRRPCAGGISPRRTARRLTPILEKQSKTAATDILWINR